MEAGQAHTQGSEGEHRDWRRFRTNFELAKLRVLDRTLEEERSLIKDQLPAALLSDVVKEDHRSMGQQANTLRVPEIPGLTLDMVLKALCSVWELDDTNIMTMHMLGQCVTEDGHGWLVDCSGPETRRKALTLDGFTFKRVALRVCKFENTSTGEAIFNKVEDRLKREEELSYLIRKRSQKRDQAPPKPDEDVT